MPRIDPERLLKCLQPLLDPNSGAIRSTDEVDKILGLMSKFSKKLVSKCIYINILRASHASVVDLFMERGGWNLVFGWTNDAIAHKNYPLLKEIFTLLMTTPVTVARLKSNRFPIVIKNFSKDCEDEETRNICKQVVSRWITIAKTEEKTDHQQHHQQQVPPPQQPISITTPVTPVQPSIPLIDPTSGGTGSGELPNLGNMNTDHLLNIDPSSMNMNMISDADGHQNLMDLDLTGSELAGIDFNLDILNKMVDDGHTLEDAIAGGGVVGGPVPVQQQQMIGGGGEMNNIVSSTPSIGAPISVIQHAPAPIQLQQQQQPQLIQHPPQQIILEQHQPQQQTHQMIQVHQQQPQLVPTTANVILTNMNNAAQAVPTIHQQQQPQQFQIIHQQPQTIAPIKVEDPQQPQQQQQLISLVQVQPPAPKLFIKTVQGQRSVVQDTGSGQYCLMVKDGKNYLVRLKEQSNVVVTSANQVTPMVVQQQQIGQSPQVPDGSNVHVPPPPLVVSQPSQDAVDSGSTAKKLSKSIKKEAQAVSPVNKVPGDIQKTYSKSKSSSSSSSKDKKSSENVKPSSSDKDHHHKSSSSSSKSKDGHHHKKSKSSSSRADSAANKAAQAAAEAKEEERLREKIRREKAQMKKRQKEMDKQKQQTEKDQETLKKLNLIPVPTGSTTSSGTSSTTSSSSSKIPKIPRRSNSSFADAIGIPGSDGSSTADKIKKVSPDKSSSSKEKEKSPNPSQQEDVTLSPRKFYGKKEEEVAAEQEKKERRHKPKVFISSKSRSDDLLKEMTESGKAKDKSSKEKEAKEKEEKEAQAAAKSATAILGNSIPATPPKMTKRLSTDSLEKPGDAKKAKLEGVKEKKHESVKDKIRKQVAASAVTLKESSLFMDAISATETTKSSKKKRRTSSGGDGKDAPKPGELTGGNELVDEVTTPTEEVKKPVFNFYRDTLNDEDSDSVSGSGDGSGDNKKDGETSEQTEGEKMDEDSNTESFTPQENDGKVKSALVLVRPRNRKKKTVKWRDEDELREFHYFEMDETERVNVTKQKDVADLSHNEMAIEGSFLKRRGEEEEPEKSKPWRLMKINFTTDILKPTIISTEKAAQEEREKNVLGLFLPPGATLPDSAIEPDVIVPSVEKPEPRPIPVEDVNTITKVCDYRTHAWPDPKGGATFGMTGMLIGAGRGGFGMPAHPPPHHQRSLLDNRDMKHHQFPAQNHLLSHQQFPPQMVPNPTSSPTAATQDYNPWNANLGFSVPPTAVPPPQDMGFGQFGAPNAVAAAAAMNLMGQGIPQAAVGFPNPFAFPPPPTPLMNGPPPAVAPQAGGIIDYGTGNSRGGNHRGGGSRFDATAERRNNNFHGGTRDSGNGRDRDRSTSRDRDYRDDRGRDRDYRSRGGDRTGNDRDYRNHNDRDRRTNNRDFQAGGRNIRKEIPCRFFKKGHCTNGSRCEFLHEGSSHSDRDRSRRSPSDEKDNHHSRHQNSNSSSNNSNDDEDWEKPISNNIPDSAQSPPQEEQVSSAPPRQSRFSDAPTPMSPTDDSPSSPVGNFQAVGESTKVIPV